MQTRHHKFINILTLFSSSSTLICCALPALFVALGAGATLAGIVTTIPQLIWLSQHKIAVFVFAGIMLTLSGVLRYKTRHAPCPLEPTLARLCKRWRKRSLILYAVSLTLYLVGFFFAFIAPTLMRLF